MQYSRFKLYILFFIVQGVNISTCLAQQYNFKYLNQKNGLASSIVNNVFQDSKGFHWFATQGGGISRYDGKEFKNYSKKEGLIGNDVTFITEDKLGNIWIAAQDGVSKFDGIQFTNLKMDGGLGSNLINSIYCDVKNKIWVCTNAGIFVFDGANCNKINIADGLSANEINAIAQDKKGNYWIVTKEGISKYDCKKIINYDKIISKNNTEQSYFSVLCDTKGNMWFGSIGFGIIKYNGIAFENQKIPAEIREDFIGSITEDYHGNIWFATDHGTLKYDGKKYTLLKEENGLTKNSVLSVNADKEGKIWMGLQDGGVNILSDETFLNYTRKDFPENTCINNIYQTKQGNYIIGIVDNGLFYFSKGIFTPFALGPAFMPPNISCIFEDNNSDLWVGSTYNGIFVYVNINGQYVFKKKITKIDNKILKLISSIFQAKDSTIFIATYGSGLNSIKNNKEKHYENTSGLTSNDILTSFNDNKGFIWIGTKDAGVFKLENGKFINYTEKDGLASNWVSSIAIDNNNNMYFGTIGEGLSCYNGKKFINISKKDGLCSNEIHAIVWDKRSNSLFIASDQGNNILHLSKDFKVEQLRFFGEQEGFKGILEYNNAILIDDKGLILFGTNNGLSTYNRKFDYPNLIPPKLYLSEIKLAYEKVDWKKFADSVDLRTNLPQNLILTHKNNHLTFYFQALTTDAVKYSYMLEGQDNQWSPPAAVTEASFNNIAPGSYTFKVKAMNSNKIWSKDTISFSFYIEPPWYKTWWFNVLFVLFVTGSVIAYIYNRTAKLAAEKRILEEKVKLRTIELKGANENLSIAMHEITDSLIYAKRIQRSFLTSENVLNKSLKNYFIFFKPRDIVSGDFYWSYELPDRTLVACADSTGHGIPGAFMSLIGISLLNEISHSKHIIEPNLILDELRRIIIFALNPERLDSGGKDGMDITLISIFKSPENEEEIKIQFSGANNTIYIISTTEGEPTLIEYKSDKQPVGFYSVMQPFTQKEIIAKKGDLIYMVTDGYADQFGGIKGKKYMTKQLRTKLLSLKSIPISMQKKILDQEFQAWKGDLDQVDDVTIMGIQI